MSNRGLSKASIQREGFLPPGTILDYGGTTAPPGFLLCYGQAVERDLYRPLFNAIGTTWGVGNGTTTFNVPDLRGRVGAGRDDMGGSAANRLTVGGSGIVATTVGNAGGTQTHTLTVTEMPSHDHAPSAGLYFQINDGVAATSGPGVSNFATTHLNSATGVRGGGGAHQNTQPTAIVNKIIYTGV